MAQNIPRPHEEAGTGAESVPPGATGKAFRRPENPPGGRPGSGAGPRHMSGDPGDGNELSDDVDLPHEESTAVVHDDKGDEDATAYSGHAGGAVGGTPAERRATGRNIHRGFAPDQGGRGDSTIGADPEPEQPRKKQQKKPRKKG